MKTKVLWSDTMPERGAKRPPVWSIAFKPNGSEMIVGVGNRVLVYDAMDGDLQHSLKGHKDTVYAVSYSADGKRFASGGADNTIIIWTHKAEGFLKYTHNESIQHIAYNPVTHCLASCTSGDFGLWSPEQKSVAKHKVLSKICCCAWTNDGQFLTLGLFNGTISLRDKDGEEKVGIERPSAAPIWCMQWKPPKDDQPYDVLAVGCWDQTLSFWQISGAQHGKDRKLDFDPCSLGYCGDGEYLVLGGSDHKATLWTKEGVRLNTVSEQKDWVWAVAPRPKTNDIAVGTNDGEIAVVSMIFNTVHGLHKERYAYRDFMTDVIVQHLITDRKVRIKCRDYVQKIAVYKDRLAVMLPERIVLYEVAPDAANNMQYRVKERIQKKLECSLLVMTSQHVILCHQQKLQAFDLKGQKEREWVLEALIKYIKVIGGAPGREGVLIGLKNGAVLEVFVDNPFPILLVRHTHGAVRCLDLSSSRRKLAVVDDKNECYVYDLQAGGALLFKESGANSVAFNTEMEDMLCFSGNDTLAIKTGEYPVHRQKMQGFVVGFAGSKIFCLHYVAMQTIDVPQSASLYRYLEDKQFDQAYAVACLGVTESDWRLLATESLQKMKLDIARKAFVRVRDMRYIELLNHIEASKRGHRGANTSDAVFVGRILAYEGRYLDAAKAFEKAGAVDHAIEMYTDLRQWDAAKAFAAKSKSMDVGHLTRMQAEWSRDTADWKSAAVMFADSGDYEGAINLLVDHKGADQLIQLARRLPKTEEVHLRRIAEFFRGNNQPKLAKECLLKIGAIEELMKLFMATGDWEEAMELAQNHPGQFDDAVFEPYAQYLAGEDRFEEAQAAYRRAGKPQMAIKLVTNMAQNATVEGRFVDAARHYFELAEEHLGIAAKVQPEDRLQHTRKARAADEQASLYHAYNFVWCFTEEPFTTLEAETVFNASRFLLNVFGSTDTAPAGVSRVHILYALAQTAETLGAYKVARWAYDRLQSYNVPQSWRDRIDQAVVGIQAKPYSDKEELIPVCTRCYTSNPLVNLGGSGDRCVQCGQFFQRCFLTFHTLPMVEFKLPPGMSTDEGGKLLDMDPVEGGSESASDIIRAGAPLDDKIDQWRASVAHGSNPNERGGTGRSKAMEDEFGRRCLRFDSKRYVPVEVDEMILRGLAPENVYVMDTGGSQPPRYFRNMVGDGVDIVLNRRRFYHGNDYEFAQLKREHSPFVECE
jgi:intraflagellar transport protein 122